MNMYEKGMNWTLRNAKTCMLMFVGALVLIAVVFQFIKKEKMPEVAHEDVLMMVDWNVGISIDENNRRTREIIKSAGKELETSTSMAGGRFGNCEGKDCRICEKALSEGEGGLRDFG